MGVKNAVTERFIQLCKSRNIKPNEFANRSGVTPSTVYSMLDKSRQNIFITTIKKLCDGLDIKLSEFFDNDVF